TTLNYVVPTSDSIRAAAIALAQPATGTLAVVSLPGHSPGVTTPTSSPSAAAALDPTADALRPGPPRQSVAGSGWAVSHSTPSTVADHVFADLDFGPRLDTLQEGRTSGPTG